MSCISSWQVLFWSCLISRTKPGSRQSKIRSPTPYLSINHEKKRFPQYETSFLISREAASIALFSVHLFWSKSKNQLKNFTIIDFLHSSLQVTVFPQKEKFETRTVKESWPTINEEFTFNLTLPTKRVEDYFKGKFVSFTIYAVLGEEENNTTDKPSGILKRFLSFTDTDDFIRRDSIRRTPSMKRSSFRNSLCNRRTVGAVTYSLDGKIFTQNLRNNFISTPDIWRHVKEITSGIQTQPVSYKYYLFITLCSLRKYCTGCYFFKNRYVNGYLIQLCQCDSYKHPDLY